MAHANLSNNTVDMKFDVIEWCEDNIDNAKLNQSNQIVGDCPWCGKHGHFYVDAEDGHYICFSCSDENPSVGRYMVGLISHVEGVSINEARRFIMKNRVEFRRKETASTLVEKIVSHDGAVENSSVVRYPLPPEYLPVYDKGKWRYPVYLKERGVSRNTAKAWKLGWARNGRYGGRIIIPISCPNGYSFTARDVTGNQEPRYLNPRGADHGRLLLGWDENKVNGDLVIVEGPLDAIKMWQHGVFSLAVMGKTLHVEQMIMLAKRPADSAITIMLDPEEHEAPYNVAEQLICRFDYVSIAKLPEGEDPGSASAEQINSAILNSLPYKGNRIDKISKIVKRSAEKLSEIY